MIIKEKWGLRYYAEVMAILSAAFCDKRYRGHFAFDGAYNTREYLAKYAYIDRYDCENLLDVREDTTVRITLTNDEARIVHTLVAFAQSGDIAHIVWPEDPIDNRYVRELIGKAVLYERTLRIRRDKCLALIGDYVEKCEAEGRKIIKKSLAGGEFSYSYILETWREFDEARRQGKSGPGAKPAARSAGGCESNAREPFEPALEEIDGFMGESAEDKREG